jgi:2-polyprenyl-6-methoxyphenol hydroxylase-like FAD-dependent oxidoreductase
VSTFAGICGREERSSAWGGRSELSSEEIRRPSCSRERTNRPSRTEGDKVSQALIKARLILYKVQILISYFILVLVSLPLARCFAANDYDLIVIGAGPGGLQTVLSAVRNGVDPRRILIIEKRDLGHRNASGSYGSRKRVIVLDKNSTATLEQSGLHRLPGVELKEMVVFPSDGNPRFIPNQRGWKDGVRTLFGGRDYERLTTLGDLERSQLDSIRSTGSNVLLGKSVNLEFSAEGRGFVTLDARRITSELIVAIDGANGSTASDKFNRINVASESTSHYLSIDIPVGRSAIARPGDLMAYIDPKTRAVIYGFVAPESASVTALLPPGVDIRDQRERIKYLDLLKSTSVKFGLPEVSPVASGVEYDGQLSMADRTTLGKNVIIAGDKLRKVDPIAGTGANAALADGNAIGAYFGLRRRGVEESSALSQVRENLAGTTRYAFEHSLYFRELASWMRSHPDMAMALFGIGLTDRAGGTGLLDSVKNLYAALTPRIIVDPLLHASVRASGVPLPFESPARDQMIGPVHPYDRLAGCVFEKIREFSAQVRGNSNPVTQSGPRRPYQVIGTVPWTQGGTVPGGGN